MDYFLKMLPLGPLQTNCYVIGNPESKECLIIDPGDEAAKLKSFIRESGYTPVAVLLTHGHFDHIGAANEIRAFYGIKIYAAAAEKELLADPDLNESREMGGCDLIVKPDVELEDGETLEIAGMHITALLTPGHTVGSMSFFFPVWKLMFSGDLLFLQSVGRCDLPTGDEATLLDTIINRVYAVLPDDVTVLPGHGPGTSLEYERRNNPYFMAELATKRREDSGRRGIFRRRKTD